jgi:spore germination protein YaaH
MEEISRSNLSNKPKSKKIKYFLGFLAIIVLILASIYIYLKITYPTASVLISAEYIKTNFGENHANMKKEVIGFLPYWRLDDTKYLRFDLLSEIIFFSLSADENGQIVKVVNNETDPGWRWWNSQTVKNLIAKTQINNTKFSLTIAMQKNKTLESFLDNKQAQQTLIDNLLKIVKSDKLNGLNIDFEYDGKPDDSYRQKFTEFAKNLSMSFKNASPNTELSIDFFPLSIQKPRLYDVASLAPYFDRVIVMSYDYYSGSSDLAGPVAPISGYIASPSAKQKSYFFDVETTYSDFTKVVPKDKLIMGVPYYGWDYPVEDNTNPLSKILPQNDYNGYAEVISYGRARTNTDLKPENCYWEDVAKATWCTYTDSNNVQREVWLEDNKSIEYKFDFSNLNNLAGIAIWTLGYDKDYPDIWNLIKLKFTKSN